MNTILVCIDFGKGIEPLLARALELSSTRGAKLWLIHVAAPDSDFIGLEEGPQLSRDNRAKELREEHRQLGVFAGQLRGRGAEAEALLVQGFRVETILEEAQRLGADLVLAGRREHGFLHRLFAGDMAETLGEESTVPVELVNLD